MSGHAARSRSLPAKLEHPAKAEQPEQPDKSAAAEPIYPIHSAEDSQAAAAPARSAASSAAQRDGDAGGVTGETARTLDDFFAAVGRTNPLASNRVSEPSPQTVDVPAIHDQEFRKLTQLARTALERGRRQAEPREGLGAMLLGNPGIGKSHLLSRLWNWSQQSDNDGGQRAGGKQRPRAVYVFLHNLLAAPERLPRYLLHSVVSLLIDGKRRPYHQTPLYDIVHAAVKTALREAGESNETTARRCQRAFRKLAATLKSDLRIHNVFLEFFIAVNLWRNGEAADWGDAEAAVDWLSGDAIDPEAAARLGLPPGEDSAALRDNQDVEHVLIALSELIALAGRSFVVCIDQCDNLPADNMKALGQFLQPLVEHSPNLLLIVCGVQETMLNFRERDVFSEAVWDRLAEHKFELKRIAPHLGREIVEARLRPFLTPFLEIPEIRQAYERNEFFPLGEKWFEQHTADGLDLRPRDVLTWGREAWEREQTRLMEQGGPRWLETWSDRRPPGPSRTTAAEFATPADAAAADESASAETMLPSSQPAAGDSRGALIDALVRMKIDECLAQRQEQAGSLPPDADNWAALVESLLKHCTNSGGRYPLMGVERHVPRNAQDRLPYSLTISVRRPSGGELRSGLAFVSTGDGRESTGALRRLLKAPQPPDRRLLITDEDRRPLPLAATGQELYRELTDLGPDRFRHLRLNFEQHARLDALHAVIGQAQSGDLEIHDPQRGISPVAETEVIESLHRQDQFREHPLLRELLAAGEP